MAIEPICGMKVAKASALRGERDRQTFYFCRDHCRQRFRSTPATAKHEKQPVLLYEHSVFTQGVIGNIDSVDQWDRENWKTSTQGEKAWDHPSNQ